MGVEMDPENRLFLAAISAQEDGPVNSQWLVRDLRATLWKL